MFTPSHRRPPARRSPAEPVPADALVSAPRDPWIDSCFKQLARLRPRAWRAQLRRLAQSLWSEVGHFDPVIAAEMEHESSLDD